MAELLFNDKIDNNIDYRFLEKILFFLDLDDEKSAKARNLYIKNTYMLLESLQVNSNILVNGEVQSGKTNNIILTAASINASEKYDIIIYLTGRLNTINEQNHSRFFDIFSEFKNEYIITKVINPDRLGESLIDILKLGKTAVLNMLKDPAKIKSLVKLLEDYGLSFILINDEGDDSSLSEKGKEVMNKISNLKNRKRIITITASPYENLEYEDYYDDYLILESSEFYTGIEKFNYIPIDDDIEDEEIIKSIIDDWIKKSIGVENTQLLINRTVNTDFHKNISDMVREYLEDLKMLSNDKDVKKFVSRVLFNDWVEISNREFVIDKEGGNQIIIGGHNLSRGVTYKYLTHQLLFSDSIKTKAGTLIQRARWCGYRQTENVKIYMTPNLINGFKELIDLQEWTKNYKIGQRNYKEKFKGKKYSNIKLKN